jgi:hypothetical protein
MDEMHSRQSRKNELIEGGVVPMNARYRKLKAKAETEGERQGQGEGQLESGQNSVIVEPA